MEQLTTQLLWRLQQSSPHHTSSATNIILPSLPEALPELQAPQQIAKLLHGLEESQGALYEIGVSDDGTLVGLAEDEMQESLNNLRAMAACLGCTVEVLREETVGECEWLEDLPTSTKGRTLRRVGKLVVAEALIKPFLPAKSPLMVGQDVPRTEHTFAPSHASAQLPSPETEQLRVTLAGPTMSGKSTLLGTLTTSTLDNGRGKSRLSMLKHRHEITSGVTSSVTQELLGYRNGVGADSVAVVNYASENIASWIDIHVASASRRVVLVSDSAGHPRYRRTTLRGLVGWAPHWTLLCIPADSGKDTAEPGGGLALSPPSFGATMPEMDLSGAQLDLCLRLGLPLVVVITKLDLASRAGLRESLTKVLDILKGAGRKPAILPNRPGSAVEAEFQDIEATVREGAAKVTKSLRENPTGTVPIILASSVDGAGISNLHALLHELPVPAAEATSRPANDEPSTIFHVEDIYNKPAEAAGVIVAGRLSHGIISVGDSCVIGPFSTHDSNEDSEDSDERPLPKHAPHLPASRSFPGALRSAHLGSGYLGGSNQEWRRVKVTSIRNLRLPVHSLRADQAGTIAVVLEDEPGHKVSPESLARIRKGMVIANSQPVATRSFSAKFKREDLESLAVGNHVVVYITSVRASARIVSARAPDSVPTSPISSDGDRHSAHGVHEFASPPPFDFDDIPPLLESGLATKVAGIVTAPELLVTFNFDASREFAMVGDQVLVMPGGGPSLYGGQERGEKGVAGLEGFVGTITEVHG